MGLSTEQIQAYRAYLRAVQKTDKFHEFRQIMEEFLSLQEHDTSTLPYVAERIKDVFRGDPKLILGFNDFLPRRYEINLTVEEDSDEMTPDRVEEFNEASDSDRVLHHGEYHPEFELFELVKKEKSGNPDEYQQYLKCFHLFSNKIISRKELLAIVIGLLEQDHKKNQREIGFEASASKKRKHDNPNYKLSTETALASGRTKLGKAVLNDTWVSESTSIGDKYDFKKNVYQENLFTCEDQRCEYDRKFHLVKGTTKCVQRLKRKIEENKVNPNSIRIEDHFKVLQLRKIRRVWSKSETGRVKRLCSKSNKDLVDEIRKNAIPVLNRILTLLEEKKVRAQTRISNLLEKMREIYSKNHKKSLYFGSE
ncbi:hypothetical protein MKW98_018930 [Papaver atlanticum]|uniref:Histone deacetylase interacting domain-containing protein n=1 Tax=Papaver atlanticum TaxID=357466 RepID=A0AAD4XXX1_9MAGN|nr:hypothetical protein MKW98_018930 [Papaver atlanticum]